MRRELKMEIKSEIMKEITDHCESMPTKESCGLVFGNGMIDRCIKGKNLSNGNHTYVIDEATSLKVFDKGFIGTYHSHLFIPAYPSSIDFSGAYFKDKLHLIYSLGTKELNAFLWNGERFVQEELVVVFGC